MPARVYQCDASEMPALKKMLEYDPYLDKSLTEDDLKKIKGDPEANVIFARQDYLLRDGASLSLDSSKYFLYLSAGEDFLNAAEKKLEKNIKSIKRLDQESERKVIETIEDERTKAEEGFGAIFG
ncbi:MAG: hypothetical protein ACP5K9_01585 [Candidatus Micrarchaeia archaeon]